LFALETGWLGASRLPKRIAAAGMAPVALTAPETTWLDAPELAARRTIPPMGNLRSALQAATEAWRPVLILPCDDRAAVVLTEWLIAARQRVYDPGISHKLLALLRRSLGRGPYGERLTRSGFAKACARAGIASPEQVDVRSLSEARSAVDQLGGAAIVKSEGSTAGGGVRLASTAPEAEAAWRSLFPHGRGSAVAQRFVDGMPAMATFAAFEGRLLAALTAEKTETHQPFGPAKVVRFVSDAEMTDAAAKFARTIGFTGIGSLDFIRREHGKPLAIEFNPRATLLVDTGARMGVDLMGALAGAIRGEKSLVEPVRQMAVCSLALGS
jgi:hypothetical protein